ncbi:MDR family MFS transporter [Microterricola pindariensis]|uniref:MFS transporter n=1 Tax=Microterricola pindariensis TaxID=478010 RepID=A0ABX5ATX0_9MICO|nr:MDR family MFS transporter [Microterricola pindariensis]PPL15642.1 MFS transporter [Microterricola pindariensis]
MTERTAPDAESLDTSSVPLPLDPAVERRNNKVIWLLVASTFVVFLNETTMGVALRPIMESLHVDERAGQWLTTAFLLTMAVVIPITGYLLQRFNTRPIYIAAMSLFSVGTAIALFAPSFEVLLAARVVQASGTAIMMPLLMTTLMTLVPPHHRGKMMGNVSIVMSVAPAIGPTFSGLMLNSLGWRGIFGVMLPIGLAMLAYGMRKVENVSEPRKVPLDVLSVVLSAIGFGGLIYGLSAVGQESTSAVDPAMVGLIGGGIALVLFVLRQLVLQRRDEALLDLRTFRFPQFTISLAMMLVMMASLFGVIIVLPLFMLGVLGLDPVTAGLLLLPGGILMGVIAPFVGRLFDRFGPRPLLVPGTVLVSAVLWTLTIVDENTSIWFLLAAHMVMSFGLALIFTPLFTSALGAVSPRFYSHASAMLSTLQQLAGAAGTALFITVLASQTAQLLASGATADAAAAGGTRAAFTIGAIISLLAIVGAFFVKKPADMEGVHAGH